MGMLKRMMLVQQLPSLMAPLFFEALLADSQQLMSWICWDVKRIRENVLGMTLAKIEWI